MNDFFLYKKQFITFILLLGYAYMHIQLTGIYIDTSLDKLTLFSARLPYGQRVLVPLLAHCVMYFLPITFQKLYFLIEWGFISLSYFALFQLLRQEFTDRQAQVLSWLFLLLLPLMSVINYRFTTQGEATFFYPYDTPALFFMAMGFLLCLREQWYYYIPLVFLATVNRESSILLVLLIPALHWKKLHLVYKPILFSLFTYCFARWLVVSSLRGIPGSLVEWYSSRYQSLHFEVNLYWLFHQSHFLLFMFCFFGLPLFWFAFYDYILIQFRPLRYVLLLYFLALLCVGNFSEARIFTEIIVLLYLPVCVALKRWLVHLPPLIPQGTNKTVVFIDRYAVLVILGVVVVFHQLWKQALLCLL